ncbi:MAG: CDGSH iron-sulfur domain-containing protein [Acidimicrobiia bacterium]|nr:CDGSH iron-sulfur domain-containing protein [Acidimicrobiia bacterium]
MRIEDSDGMVFDTLPRATLCRCGNTKNAPFCDLSHRRVGFIENTRAVAPERVEADSPAAITWADDD